MVNASSRRCSSASTRSSTSPARSRNSKSLEGLPPEALFGDWVFEWYWKQPGVPHVAEFVADISKRTGGKVPTARTWFGFAAIWTCELAAEKAKSLDAVEDGEGDAGLQLPPEVALMPNNPYYRAGDNQLMPTLFVGQSQPAPAGGDAGRSVQGRPARQGRPGGAVGRRDRLQDDLAELSVGRAE